VTTTCGITPFPYFESFESITAANTLPTCMASTSLGTNVTTNLSGTTYNRIARTGSKSASYRWASSEYIFTPSFNFTAGYNYQVSFWYIADGIAGFDSIVTRYGASQSAAGMTTLVGSPVLSPVNTTYAQWTGTFTPTSTGANYSGIKVASASSSPWYITIDDISVQVLSTIVTSTSSMAFGNVNVGLNSTTPFTVSGNSLVPASGNITIAAPTGYQVSTSSSSGFADSITVPYTGSSLSTTTIYARFAPGSVGAFGG
ncbi:MAG: hypothetical protein ACOVOV_01910, partial [Dolichospermum sp.]